MLDLAAWLCSLASKYPHSEVQDTYKTLFQAILGPEHALTDIEAARQYFAREVLTLSPEPGPLVEPLSPMFCRIHLRAALFAKLSLAEIFAAFVVSAGKPVDKTALVSLLQQWPALVTNPTEVQAYVIDLLARGCPVVSHSERYRQAYQPSYRVLHVSAVSNAWLMAHNQVAHRMD